MVILAVGLGVIFVIGWTLAAFRRGRLDAAADLRMSPQLPIFVEHAAPPALEVEPELHVPASPLAAAVPELTAVVENAPVSADSAPPSGPELAEVPEISLPASESQAVSAPDALPDRPEPPAAGETVYVPVPPAEAFAVIAKIRELPPQTPLGLILFGAGGQDFDQLAALVKARGLTTAYIPYGARAGAALVALSACRIVFGRHAVLGPVESEFHGFPSRAYIRLLREKPLAAIADEVLLTAYCAEKDVTEAPARIAAAVNAHHHGVDELAAALPAGIRRERAIALGLNVAPQDCPAEIYALAEAHLAVAPPAAGSFPGTALPETGEAEILRHLVNAAFGFAVRHFGTHSPARAQVRGIADETQAYLREIFKNHEAFIDQHWPAIFDKLLSLFAE